MKRFPPHTSLEASYNDFFQGIGLNPPRTQVARGRRRFFPELCSRGSGIEDWDPSSLQQAERKTGRAGARGLRRAEVPVGGLERPVGGGRKGSGRGKRAKRVGPVWFLFFFTGGLGAIWPRESGQEGLLRHRVTEV